MGSSACVLKPSWIVINYGDPTVGLENLKLIDSRNFSVFFIHNGPVEIDGTETTAKVVYYPDNPGYLGAVVRLFREEKLFESSGFEWVVVSNADVRSLVPPSFGVDASDIGVIGPTFIAGSRTWQPRSSGLLYLAFSFFRLKLSLLKVKIPNPTNVRIPRRRDGKLVMVHGSLFAVRLDVLSKIATLSAVPKLYGEEVLLARVIKHMNLKVTTDSSWTAHHSGGLATDLLLADTEKREHKLAATKLLMKLSIELWILRVKNRMSHKTRQTSQFRSVTK